MIRWASVACLGLFFSGTPAWAVIVPTYTPTPVYSPTPTPTRTPTRTPTAATTPTPTAPVITPTPISGATATPTPTATVVGTPAATPTPTPVTVQSLAYVLNPPPGTVKWWINFLCETQAPPDCVPMRVPVNLPPWMFVTGNKEP